MPLLLCPPASYIDLPTGSMDRATPLQHMTDDDNDDNNGLRFTDCVNGKSTLLSTVVELHLLTRPHPTLLAGALPAAADIDHDNGDTGDNGDGLYGTVQSLITSLLSQKRCQQCQRCQWSEEACSDTGKAATLLLTMMTTVTGMAWSQVRLLPSCWTL